MVPSTFIWSKQVKPFAPSKRKHSHLETSTCNSITPSQTSRTLQHNTRCSSHTNSSTHCPFTFCKSVRYSCTLTHVLIFFENDRKKKQAGTNSSSPSNPHHLTTPTHHPHPLSPPPPPRSLLNTNSRFYPPRSFLSTIPRPPHRCLDRSITRRIQTRTSSRPTDLGTQKT